MKQIADDVATVSSSPALGFASGVLMEDDHIRAPPSLRWQLDIRCRCRRCQCTYNCGVAPIESGRQRTLAGWGRVPVVPGYQVRAEDLPLSARFAHDTIDASVSFRAIMSVQILLENDAQQGDIILVQDRGGPATDTLALAHPRFVPLQRLRNTTQ